MQKATVEALRRVLVVAAVLVIFKVTLSVVVGYRDYVPPNFDADFLLGRESYFFGPYRWAFYAHLLAGPASLIMGTMLVSDGFRKSAPKWHRRLGRFQVACILLLLVPSGMWMAWYAATGMVAGMGLGLLAVTTATCAALGWRAAVVRRFEEHRRWMWRVYLLLCSAVMIRVMGGLATVLGIDGEWVYPVSVWVSWVGPLVAFELWRTGGAIRRKESEQEGTERTKETISEQKAAERAVTARRQPRPPANARAKARVQTSP